MNLGGKISSCSLKLHSTCPMEHFELKKLFLKVLFFFQNLQNIERTITVLGVKIFGRDSTFENCSLRLKRSIKKSNFWSFSLFFKILLNFQRTIMVLGEKLFGRDIKTENCSLRLIRSNKKSNFWKFSLFFKIFRTLNEHLPCLAKKFWAGVSKLKIVLYVFRVSFWGWKWIFESLVSFHLFRTWNIIVLDLRQQSFHPVCQKCNLRVYMISLRIVGIRSDITWRETFFEPWRKNFELFLKTAFYVSNGTLWVEKTFFESSVFFQNLQNFERTITVLGVKIFGRDITFENCSLRLKRSIKNSNFWKFSLFFKILLNFERTIIVLGEKLFGRDIKTENCSLRLIRSNKKSNFWKISFFFKIFRTLNEHLPCLAKKFWAGVSKLEIVLYVFRVSFWGWKWIFESLVSVHLFRTWDRIVFDLRQQSFHPVCQKCNLRVYMISLRGVGIRSDITWRETFFEPWRKNFELFLKTAFYVSKGTLWVKKTFFEISVFFQKLQNFERTITVLGVKNFVRDITIENCSLRLKRSIKKSNFWRFSLFFKFYRTLNEQLLCSAKNFSAGISKLKIAVFVS